VTQRSLAVAPLLGRPEKTPAGAMLHIRQCSGGRETPGLVPRHR
jgi:hypothetical protein